MKPVSTVDNQNRWRRVSSERESAMPYRLYYSPLIHCPRLCPYDPPRELFRDDYDPVREELAETFCGGHCGNRIEDHKPCLLEREAKRSLLEHHSPSV
jgi:hypothetical protein